MDNALRAAALSDKGRHVLVEHQGLRFEVREPTVGQRARYVDTFAALADRKPTAEEVSRGIAGLLVRCVYDPGTGARVFEDSDVEALFDAGREIVQKLSGAVLALIADAKADAGKESEVTPSSAAVSSSENS